MAVIYEQVNMPLTPVNGSFNIGGDHKSYWPLPTRHHRLEDYYFSTRIYKDDSWPGGVPPSKKYVYYFHGSGGTWPNLTADGYAKTLLEAGICLVSPMYYGAGASPPSPYRHGYGNVNAPGYMGHFIKTAFWVEAAYQHMLTLPADSSVVFLGQSMGAAAVLAWVANFASGPANAALDPRFKGVMVSGATVGGLGDLTWNDIVRNLSSFSQIVSRMRQEIKAIIIYTDEDGFAPPDYARRLEMVTGRHGLARPQYFLSPGAYPHNWYNLRPDLVLMWVNQLLDGATITQRDGSSPASSVA